MRRDFTFEMPPGRIASSTSSTGARGDRLPAREALAQPRVGDVAVAVVGVLGEDRQHQLVERSAVRHVAGMPVEAAQPVADRAHAAPVAAASRRSGAGFRAARAQSYRRAPRWQAGAARGYPRGPMTGARAATLERPSWVPRLLSAPCSRDSLRLGPARARPRRAHLPRRAVRAQRLRALERAAGTAATTLLTYSVLFPPLAALLAPGWSGLPRRREHVSVRSPRARALGRARATRHAVVRRRARSRCSPAAGSASRSASRSRSRSLRALQRGRRKLAVAAALGCALASPVAAALPGRLVAVGRWLAPSLARRLALLAVVAPRWLPVALLNMVFADGGREPFCVLGLDRAPALVRGRAVGDAGLEGERELRAVILAYLVVGTLIWLMPNPMGGNATRLGALFGGPVLAAALLSRGVRRRAPAGRAGAGRQPLVAALAGRAATSLRAWATPRRDAVLRAARPLAARERRRATRRIEVPFTSGHWETAYLAPDFELARGWLRQLDRTRNGLFYDGELTSGATAAGCSRTASAASRCRTPSPTTRPSRSAR